MPTLLDWLTNNDYYDQAVAYDINGKEMSFWYENDPKYKANVLRVEPEYPEYPWLCAKIYTDWKGEDNE